MRTETVTKTYYNFDELNEQAKETALQNEREFLVEDFSNFTFDYEYLPVLEQIEKLFDVSRSEWETDFYNRPRYNVEFFYDNATIDNIETYNRLRTYVVNNILPHIEKTEKYKSTGRENKSKKHIEFRGEWTDFSPIDILTRFLNGEIGYRFDTPYELVNEMCLGLLQSANNEVNSLQDEAEENIYANGYEFDENGNIA